MSYDPAATRPIGRRDIAVSLLGVGTAPFGSRDVADTDASIAATFKAFGLGVNDWSILLRFAADGDFDCFMLAGRYTLLDHTALDTFMPECERRGISVLMAAPFNSGILASGARPGATFFYKEADAEIMTRTGRIEAVCARHGVALAAAALQFPLAHPAV